MKNIFLLIFLAMFSCSEQEKERPVETKQPAQKDSLAINYKLLEKMSVTGDFNGDGIQDTIFQHNINAETGLSIDSCPDPWKHEWDSVVTYLSKNHSRVTLSSSLKDIDTLSLTEGMGLFCLINIGDNNHDKKDEIAMVVDLLDVSRLNSCRIYTICGKTWLELKAFSVYEGAFDSYGKEPVPTDRIEGFLEKKNGTWKYLDYIDELRANDDSETGRFKPLRLKSCKS